MCAIAEAVRGAHVFVFTMGLTEAWVNKATGVEYAVCPGTVAGAFDAEAHQFVNHGFGALMGDMTAALRLMFRANRRLIVLLTVSPVPLTATASGQHVLTASSLSKSMLRAVASELVQTQARVDYFPSYELVAAPPIRGAMFNPNLRTVATKGVDIVMSHFFQQHAPGPLEAEQIAKPRRKTPAEATPKHIDDVICEEEMLERFA